MPIITESELQGAYDISYQSTPQLADWYEPGFGAAKIEGNNLTGIDGLGVKWNATFSILENGKIRFEALLDPSDAAPNAGLMDKQGNMTRAVQTYAGELSVTNHSGKIILRTRVQQGPITIDVQFLKR